MVFQRFAPALKKFKIQYRRYSRLVYDRNEGRICEKLIHLAKTNPYSEVRAVESSKMNPHDLRPQGP